MDDDTKIFMRAIRDDIKTGNAEINGKLDAHSRQFVQHQIEDTKALAQLEAGQIAIRQQMTDRRAESDWRKQQSFVERSGKYALWAAALGALALWILEHFIAKK